MKRDYIIRKHSTDEAIPYDLLLLADETKEAIDKYISTCTIFTLVHRITNEIVGVMAVKQINSDTVELKNIAITAQYQAQGLGSDMLSFLKSHAQEENLLQIWVGTADVGFQQHRFYMRNGFEMNHIRHNFFIENYADPIIENGLQMKHMLVFAYRLKTNTD
ncbi:GNAT family N-acetyltransferase [Sphingobacterium anhuiense]|uniref:GNAT family N-acetyltransferase n=1 Tax=Sphingobacterium anhuiense TaxID=493780 RepID=A0ABW5YXX2_9SPHI